VTDHDSKKEKNRMSHDRKHTEGNLHIKDWPEGDRPREMLLEKGADTLSDAALLAILLIGFQIKILDCVIGRFSRRRTYMYDLLENLPLAWPKSLSETL